MTTSSAPADRSWSDPVPDEVAPGVVRIPLPLPEDGLRAVNVYALRDPATGAVTLIDGGWAVAGAREALAAGLHAVGSAMGDLTDVLVTHAHRDHYTLAAVIRAEHDLRIGLGSAERVNLETILTARSSADALFPKVIHRAGAVEAAAAMVRRGFVEDLAPWQPPDRWLDAGTVVETAGRALRVVHTPGHTRGHVCYLDEEAGLLFSGDHVLTTITPSIGFEAHPVASPLADFLASLQLLAALPDARVLPGHGPVGPSVHARVAELLAHHDERLDAVLDAVRDGATTGFEVAQRLTWTRRHRPFETLDGFNQMLATSESFVHLALLADRGLLTREVDPDSVVRHALVPPADAGPGPAGVRSSTQTPPESR